MRPTAEKIRAVLVDDESLARGLLREYLAPHTEIEIVGEAEDGYSAIEIIVRQKPALVFLDVQMPGPNGLEVAELIDPAIAVVFTTAHDRFAIQAFELHAVDYLLKPFSVKRFEQALARARERVGLTNVIRPPLARAALPKGKSLDRVVVRDGARAHVVPLDRLDYVQAQDDYVSLHTDGRELLKQETLASFESCLDPEKFVRIHRSWLVNVAKVVRVEGSGKESREVVLGDGKRLPVSRAGWERLKQVLNPHG